MFMKIHDDFDWISSSAHAPETRRIMHSPVAMTRDNRILKSHTS